MLCTDNVLYEKKPQTKPIVRCVLTIFFLEDKLAKALSVMLWFMEEPLWNGIRFPAYKYFCVSCVTKGTLNWEMVVLPSRFVQNLHRHSKMTFSIWRQCTTSSGHKSKNISGILSWSHPKYSVSLSWQR